jgi:NAD(P)-dependent dehydrogenase (short-subunit alcohol dehydrogenase family)
MKKWTSEDIPDLNGKVAIVTGANSGIGFATAKALASKKVTVILACRDEEKGKEAVQRIGSEKSTRLIQLNLASLNSVREFVDTFLDQFIRLDILINNAGIMRVPYGKTVDGFELHFATNYLGHFALTGLLLERLIKTPKSRVVTVSSRGERFGKINFNDLNGDKKYNSGNAYGQSKLANLLFTYELDRKFKKYGLEAIAVAAHPGWTKQTNLPVHWRMIRILNPLIGQKPEMGALPSLYAATSPDVQGGDYFGPNSWMQLRGHPKMVRSSKRSYDEALASKLWEISEEITGVQYKWTS